MSKEEGATPTGAAKQEEGKSLSAEEIQSAIDAARAPRMSEMERIAASRTKAFEEEVGVRLTDDPVDTPAARTTDIDVIAEADRQVAAQEKEDDQVIDPASFKGRQLRVKVDGQEVLVDADKIIAQYQKNSAADVRLARAGETERKANEKLAEAERKLKEASTVTERKAAEKDIETAQADLDKTATEFADALYQGDPAKAGELFKKAVKSAVDGELKGRSTAATPAPVVTDEVIDKRIAKNQADIEQRRALDQLFNDYPEIKSSTILQAGADAAVNFHLSEGKTMAEAIAAAGEDVAREAKLTKAMPKGDTKSGTSTDGKEPTTREAKRAAKAAIDEIAGTAARAASTAAQPESASSVIAQMAAARSTGGI